MLGWFRSAAGCVPSLNRLLPIHIQHNLVIYVHLIRTCRELWRDGSAEDTVYLDW
jgi:hypothetical protein